MNAEINVSTIQRMDSCISFCFGFDFRRIRFISSIAYSTAFFCCGSMLPLPCSSCSNIMQALRSFCFRMLTPFRAVARALKRLPVKEQHISNEPTLGVHVTYVPKRAGRLARDPLRTTGHKALHQINRPGSAFRPWKALSGRVSFQRPRTTVHDGPYPYYTSFAISQLT